MLSKPLKTSLVAETGKCIREGISAARWRDQLPGIHRLATELEVGDSTVRLALKGLASEGLIRIKHGLPCRINPVAVDRVKTGRGWSIGLLSPTSPLHSRSWVWWSWLNELRIGAQTAGHELTHYSVPGIYRARGNALAKFIKQNPHDCWITVRSTPQMQSWLEKSGIPTIVAGTVFDGIRLPSIDSDYRALGQHAGAMIRAFGHRHVAFIAARMGQRSLPTAGVRELERGFAEGLVKNVKAGPPELVSIYHNFGDKDDMCRAFTRLIELSPRPSAAMVAHPDSFFTGASFLSQCGIVVPRDLSIVVAEDDATCARWVPELTRYEVSHFSMVRQTLSLIEKAHTYTLQADARVRLTPRFVSGKTLLRFQPTNSP